MICVDRLKSGLGISKITLLVFGILVSAVVYCAYNILPFYYYYYELINQFQSVVKVASTEDDAEIRRRLMYHIKKMELPMAPEDLIIEREDGEMRIRLQYEETFFITWQGKDYEVYTFPFDAHYEGRFK